MYIGAIRESLLARIIDTTDWFKQNLQISTGNTGAVWMMKRGRPGLPVPNSPYVKQH